MGPLERGACSTRSTRVPAGGSDRGPVASVARAERSDLPAEHGPRETLAIRETPTEVPRHQPARGHPRVRSRTCEIPLRRDGWAAASKRSTAHRLPCAFAFSSSWRVSLPRPWGAVPLVSERLRPPATSGDEMRRGHGSRPLCEYVGSGPERDCTVRLRTVPKPGNLCAFRAPARSRCAGAATPRAQQEGRGAPLFQSPCRARSTRDLGIQTGSRTRPTTPSGSAPPTPRPPA